MSDANYLDMSDEDIEKLTLPAFEKSQEPVEESNEELDSDVLDQDDDSVEDSTESVEASTEDDSDPEQTTDKVAVDEQTSTEESQEDVSTKDVKDVSDIKPEETTIDYKQAYEQVLAPFKANGKTVKVDTVEDAVQLMQMGANYNHKMQVLKPHLKVVKMLENNGLLDETRLNLMIEVAKGNPEAIKRVVAESKLDLYDVDSEKDAQYQPANYRVSDQELELDTVIQELQSSPAFSKTAEVVARQFDAASKEAIVNNPTLLRVLNTHMESGFYDEVTNEIEKQRMLGRTPNNVSAIELYGLTAKYLTEMHQQQQPQTSQATQTQVTQQVTREAERVSKKQAIAPTKQTVTSKSSLPDNLLDMSDEEFEKATRSGLFKTI